LFTKLIQLTFESLHFGLKVAILFVDALECHVLVPPITNSAVHTRHHLQRNADDVRDRPAQVFKEKLRLSRKEKKQKQDDHCQYDKESPCAGTPQD
jgi:hypothetical protein